MRTDNPGVRQLAIATCPTNCATVRCYVAPYAVSYDTLRYYSSQSGPALNFSHPGLPGPPQN